MRTSPSILGGTNASLNVMFTGDVHLGPAYNDERLFCENIRKACQENDYTVINVEGPITDSPPSERPGFLLHSSPQSANALRALGNNVFALANNHALDHGVPGLRDTLHFAREHDWTCIGAGETLAQASDARILRRDGLSVGLLAVCGRGVPFADIASPGVFGDKPERLVRKRIRELKRQVRWLVVVYHGGEEFTHIPLPARRKKLLRYLSFGADVIVAHHAHCVQRYEQVGDKLVFYGLGNLVFDLNHHRHVAGTDESVLLALSFSAQSIKFRPLFTHHDRDRHLVSRVPANSNFAEITPLSYAEQWGDEASRRLRSYWDTGHEHLVRSTWRHASLYYWRKLRRTLGLLLICVSDRAGLVRPYIIGGAMHCLRRNPSTHE